MKSSTSTNLLKTKVRHKFCQKLNKFHKNNKSKERFRNLSKKEEEAIQVQHLRKNNRIKSKYLTFVSLKSFNL